MYCDPYTLVCGHESTVEDNNCAGWPVINMKTNKSPGGLVCTACLLNPDNNYRLQPIRYLWWLGITNQGNDYVGIGSRDWDGFPTAWSRLKGKVDIKGVPIPQEDGLDSDEHPAWVNSTSPV